MAREILFRGKRVDNGEWVYGYLIYDKYCNTNIPYIGYLTIDGADVVEVIPETIGQYTGLTANGKKIFEGDIVRSCVGTYVVKFLTGSWCCSLIECEYLTLLCTISAEDVIGNIHDNKLEDFENGC